MTRQVPKTQSQDNSFDNLNRKTNEETSPGSLRTSTSPCPELARKIVVSQEKKDFKEGALGKPIKESFRVRNDSNEELAIKISVTEGSNDFEILNNDRIPAKLQKNEATTLEVAFKPPSEGTKNGVIEISIGDPPALAKTITLKGEGIQPVVDVQPLEFRFEGEIDKETAPKVFEIRNGGTGSLVVNRIELESTTDFKLEIPFGALNNKPHRDKPDEAVTFKVLFTPRSAGEKSTKILITSNVSDTPLEIPIAGLPLKLARPQILVVWGGTNRVSGATVKLRKDENDAGRALEKTASSGIAMLPQKAMGFTPGEYKVDIEYDAKQYILKPDQPILNLQLETTEPAKYELIKLARPDIKVVKNKTERWDGDGVTGVTVKLKPRVRENTPESIPRTDYEYPGKTSFSGSVSVAWGGQGIVPGEYEVELKFEEGDFAIKPETSHVNLPEGSTKTETIEVVEAARPRLEVISDTGQRLPGIVVKLLLEGATPILFTETDRDGKTSWTDKKGIPPGRYTVVLTDAEGVQTIGEPEEELLPLDQGAKSLKTIRMVRLLRPKIKVVWGGTHGIEGVVVKLSRPRGLKERENTILNHEFIKTNNEGIAVLPEKAASLKPNTYQVDLAFKTDDYYWEEKPLPIESGFDGTKQMELIKLVRPKIQIVCAEDKQFLGGRTVTLRKGTSECKFDPTNDSGETAFSAPAGLIPGTYQVEVDHDPNRYLLNTINIQLKSESEEPVPIQFVKLARPRIEVLWGNGNKAEGIGVTLKPKGGTPVQFSKTLDTGLAGMPDTVKGFLTGDFTVDLDYGQLFAQKGREKPFFHLDPGFDGIQTIQVVKLARPQIEIKCAGKGVPGVGVKLLRGTEYVFEDTDANGIAKLRDGVPGLASGDYNVELKYDKTLYKLNSAPTLTIADNEEGFEGVKTFELDQDNEVTPEIKVEYKVVLLDPNLAQYQNGETPIYADPICIELSVSESNTAYPFKEGAAFFCTGAGKVDVFLDELCTKKAPDDFTDQDLSGTKKLKLYLRGAAAGDLKATLKLKKPKDRNIKLLKETAEVVMSVASLGLEVCRNDEAKLNAITVNPDEELIATYHSKLHAEKLPAQKPLSDRAKVSEGRLLHVQKNDSFGRAKLICALNKDDWPTDANGYDVVINETNTTGAVEVYDSEWGGNKQNFPIKIKVLELKNGAKEFWVQGKTVTDNWRDVRLDVGLDRPDDPNLLPKKEKRNGDWGRFTVVEINEVKVDYTPVPGEAVAWDETNEKFHINLKQDPDGRKVTIGAQLSKPFKDVEIHFMLAPDEDNGKKSRWGIDFPTTSTTKWKDVPAALKHKDKKDRQDLLHLSAKTNDKGYATKELVLSRFGGDKFHPAAYLSEDPHLAKYVRGHDPLGNKSPVLAAKSITVWRMVWYEVARPAGMATPNMDDFAASQRRVFVDSSMQEEREMKGPWTRDPERPAWQIQPTSTDTTGQLCIGTHNVKEAIALFKQDKAAHPVKFQVIFCDAQFDAVDRSGNHLMTKVQKIVFGGKNATGVRNVEMEALGLEKHEVGVLNPPLHHDDLVVSAKWTAKDKSGGTWIIKHQGDLSAGNIEIVKGRATMGTVQVTPPPHCDGCTVCKKVTRTNLVQDADHKIEVLVQLRIAAGNYVGWAPDKSVANVVRKSNNLFDIHDTMSHELGHLFGQVRTADIAGLRSHPKLYERRGGKGPHCAEGATWNEDKSEIPQLKHDVPGQLDAQGNASGAYSEGSCILYACSRPFKLEWCEHCAFEWIFSDLSKFHI